MCVYVRAGKYGLLYVCMSVRVSTSMHVCLPVCTGMHVCLYQYVSVICMCVCTSMYQYGCMSTSMYQYVCMYQYVPAWDACLPICTGMYACMSVPVCTSMYACMSVCIKHVPLCMFVLTSMLAYHYLCCSTFRNLEKALKKILLLWISWFCCFESYRLVDCG